MRHVNNDYMRIQLQNALMAQQMEEAAKRRQAERAREMAAEVVMETSETLEANAVKKVPKGKDGKENPDNPANDPRKFRYRPDGTFEDEGGDPPLPRINIQA